ncbi:CRISPR-associated Cmr3 family protein [Nitrospirillum amazonense]|uniref:CRISPR-associated Cmr3 family protein n=1 Tax=Nitrospirillum amazonense TaxID=28077 RepID=A0A560EL23_9PROT|nr:type III-B CRISPR module-associated Cmr3 family protein [Nitrospirillum amazonense]TWB10071.1 CRISPR-associated Cmr3 family protein [Nitrospirillum amazonense]
MSDTRFYLLHPQDTLFFRDGRPFEQADDGLASATSLFPPHPSTLTGALRAALALGRGWDGRSGWDAPLTRVLGDGPGMTGGHLRFGPPLLMRWMEGGWRPLYPAPRHLLVRHRSGDGKGAWKFAVLRPARIAVATDLGALHPALPPPGWTGKEVRPATDWWLTGEGLRQVLDGGDLGGLERQAIHRDDLWVKEARVGLALAEGTRTAVRGNLYAAAHVRLARDTALGMAVSGLPADWTAADRVPLGGEHRHAHVEALAKPPAPIPPTAAFNRDGDGALVCLTALSPTRPPEHWLKPGPLPQHEGDILSACLGDPLPIGGWDGRGGATRGPQALQPFVPAGSCWFLRLRRPETLPETLGAETLGDIDDAAHGYGRYALGTYSLTERGEECRR